MNKITILGHAGGIPEDKGKKTIVSIASTDGYGENKKTNWHYCVFFGKTAELATEFIKKGSNVLIFGRLDYFKTAKGEFYTSVIVDEFHLLDKKEK
jgi:single-strand DNA-binding protein